MREIREGLKQRCVFCREPLINSAEEADKNVMERIKKNDPVAMRQWGKRHLEVDYETALQYLTKAAELGEADAHYSLSVMYLDGEGVEKDIEKAVYHAEEAAIGGHPYARYNLGCIEYESGRFDRAKKHFIIAANLGYHNSLEGLRQLYKEGYASKEDYDAARCAYQAAVEATKSPEREEGEAYYEAREAAQHSESNTTLSCIVM
jgi:TPR repeat protein